MEQKSSRIPVRAACHDFTDDGTHEVIGAFYEVYNTLRPGFLESVYAGALHWELLQRGIMAEREVQLQVRYKGQTIGAYRADIIVGGALVLELKAVHKAGYCEKEQLLHYLRATDMRLGLVLNFGPRPQVLRVING